MAVSAINNQLLSLSLFLMLFKLLISITPFNVFLRDKLMRLRKDLNYSTCLSVVAFSVSINKVFEMSVINDLLTYH